MIKTLTLNKVASYHSPTTLDTDKKVNLIYGLNGTGKTTLSDFLYQRTDSKFQHCSIDGLNDDDIIVYNQTFIRDNFYESESLQGIFTLSKKNKEAETIISNARKVLKKLLEHKESEKTKLEKEGENLALRQKDAKDTVWQIKKDYTGGDRELEFCLDGLKSDGNKLLSFLETVVKPSDKPSKTVKNLKDEAKGLSAKNARKHEQLNEILFLTSNIEEIELFNKQIVGNENSTVAELITNLENSDWVKDGLAYIPNEIGNENEKCPFCQEPTISKELVNSIKEYFDDSYEKDMNTLNELLETYTDEVNGIPDKSVFSRNPQFESHKKDFEIKYSAFRKAVERNIRLIKDKIKSPSQSIKLKSSNTEVAELNAVIDNINKQVREHNFRIERKEAALEEIKEEFWGIMRWEYDQTLNTFIKERSDARNRMSLLKQSINDIKSKEWNQKAIIAQQQKETVNIEGAISSINIGLLDLGIEDFKIQNYSENLYKIVREKNDTRIFHSLSEGEKMIISFLYFLELCKGRKDSLQANNKKIIVIDDPISSLSHIYVFNIGRIIHNEFLRNNDYEQVFLLTHSLYFFYEMTEINHEKREKNQKLFRIIKNSSGSEILEMKYEEIQNDYHSYWSVIKDKKQPPALIANCMRNIIEYFFNFVEKRDLNNVFQKPVMKETRFQAFNRYISRESHSLGQNIFDIKEFDYEDFKDAFALVFKENGYEEHYIKMMK